MHTKLHLWSLNIAFKLGYICCYPPPLKMLTKKLSLKATPFRTLNPLKCFNALQRAHCELARFLECVKPISILCNITDLSFLSELVVDLLIWNHSYNDANTTTSPNRKVETFVDIMPNQIRQVRLATSMSRAVRWITGHGLAYHSATAAINGGAAALFTHLRRNVAPDVS
jgi:hypothetical protein